MIDAYEIGIQLLLQEDVSAGLEVINRGLAEVDRAIAATSADLAGLGSQGGAATKAVAAAVGSRAKLPPASGQRPDDTIEQPVTREGDAGRTAAPPRTEIEAKPTPTVTSQVKAAAPDVQAAEPSSPQQSLTDQPSETVRRRPPAPEQMVPASAPVRNDGAESARDSQQVNSKQAGPEEPASAVSARVEPAAPSSNSLGAPLARRILPLGPESRGSEKLPHAPLALTASVAQVQRSGTAGGRSERERHQSVSGPAARRERPVAPWSGVDHLGQTSETARSHDKVAAPQPAGRNESESGGGTVMLDGRLVGQWLSEHMGREASRPPSGTSFFDPRQTPAWNVSGAL